MLPLLFSYPCKCVVGKYLITKDTTGQVLLNNKGASAGTSLGRWLPCVAASCHISYHQFPTGNTIAVCRRLLPTERKVAGIRPAKCTGNTCIGAGH